MWAGCRTGSTVGQHRATGGPVAGSHAAGALVAGLGRQLGICRTQDREGIGCRTSGEEKAGQEGFRGGSVSLAGESVSLSASCDKWDGRDESLCSNSTHLCKVKM